MNENIDLTKILKGCPKGTKFDSIIFGEVEFFCIDKGNYPVIFMTKTNIPISVTKRGKHLATFDGECVLLPSKHQRDWSKFERFWDKPNNSQSDKKVS